MSDNNSDLSGIPEGEKWITASYESTLHDLGDIDEMIDDGKVNYPYYFLEEHYIPRSKKTAGEWLHLRARVQTKMKKGNYKRAFRLSSMALEYAPNNPRYHRLHLRIEHHLRNEQGIEDRVNMGSHVREVYQVPVKFEPQQGYVSSFLHSVRETASSVWDFLVLGAFMISLYLNDKYSK